MNTFAASIKKYFFKLNPWKKYSIIIIMALAVSFAIARLTLSHVIIYSVTSWLNQQNIVTSIEDIDINILDGEISFINAHGNKYEKTLFDIGLLTINWQWGPIAQKNIVINNITLDAFSLDIEHYSDAIILGGVYLPSSDADTAQPEKLNRVETVSWQTSLQNFNFIKSDVCYKRSNKPYSSSSNNTYQESYCIKLDSTQWNGDVNYSANNNDLISINGDLRLTDINIHDLKLNRDVTNINKLTLNKVDLIDFSTLTINQIIVNDFTALQRSATKSDTTLSFSDFILTDTRYRKTTLSINAIKLTNLSTNVSINKNTNWEHDKWHSNKENKHASPSQNEMESKPLLISIQSAVIQSDKAITLTDNSTNPATKISLNQFDFSINGISSKEPEANSPFKLSATTSHHSTIKLEGTVRPLANNISIDAKGKLKGFDLRIATPESKKAIGHIIKSGHMDADLKILANNGKLDSKIKLSLYQFHIKPMSESDTLKLEKDLGMPLNQTLILLRDKDDNIHLDIPITGDINKPDFDPMHAIVKATTKAATAALITFYTPYGLVYVGGTTLFDIATALNFDPISFEPGSSKLTVGNKKQLAELASLLTEKPEIHLSLCGTTSNDDAYIIYPDLKQTVIKKQTDDWEEDETFENHTDTTVKLNAEQAIPLNNLATNRQIASKDYLIKTKKIAHNRLILCEPEHQPNDETTSGVAINI